MTGTTLTKTEEARTRYDEASDVVEAFHKQVVRYRQAWALAPTPDHARRAKGRLAAATWQHQEAKAIEQAAWQAWHMLNTAGRIQ